MFFDDAEAAPATVCGSDHLLATGKPGRKMFRENPQARRPAITSISPKQGGVS